MARSCNVGTAGEGVLARGSRGGGEDEREEVRFQNGAHLVPEPVRSGEVALHLGIHAVGQHGVDLCVVDLYGTIVIPVVVMARVATAHAARPTLAAAAVAAATAAARRRHAVAAATTAATTTTSARRRRAARRRHSVATVGHGQSSAKGLVVGGKCTKHLPGLQFDCSGPRLCLQTFLLRVHTRLPKLFIIQAYLGLLLT